MPVFATYWLMFNSVIQRVLFITNINLPKLYEIQKEHFSNLDILMLTIGMH